jgi:hypothetical protein
MFHPRPGLGRPSRNVVASVLLAVAFLVVPGCGPDMGPPPDQSIKNNPVAPASTPEVRGKGAGAPLKVKSIKDRS